MPKATECKLGGRALGIDEAVAIRQGKREVAFRCVKCGERGERTTRHH